MKIETLSIVVGSMACNAECPFCVGKMTPSARLSILPRVPERNLRIACRFAQNSGVSTALLTGKGEPTLYPDHITQYIEILSEYFPFIELQTNGINIPYQKLWYDKGLTTVGVSIVHPNNERNGAMMTPGGPEHDIWDTVHQLHKANLSVRINCTMVKGMVDSISEVGDLIRRCRKAKVEQLTVREVARPTSSEDKEIWNWVSEHNVDGLGEELVQYFTEHKAPLLLELPHGAKVYDCGGQNVCVNNCLTETTNPDEIRQLILFPDGHLRYSWVYPGAIIL